MCFSFLKRKHDSEQPLETAIPENTNEREDQNEQIIPNPDAGEEEITDGQKPAAEEEDEVVLPPEPELAPPVHGIVKGISYWGFSQRGESHVKNGMPCQDRCLIEVISGGPVPLIAAAIADGVGSCMLSHYGAATATRAAIDSLKKDLADLGKVIRDDADAGRILRAAMQAACDTVSEQADKMEQFEYSFQSTLTLAVYDGSTLYYAHAGDDGIVAILNDGKMDLITVRHKGEEASSVYPLQSLQWDTRKAENVNAFVMATDGVLDAFVRGEIENNRIYYPFIQPAVKPGQTKDDKIKEVADFYYSYMEGPKYRSKVTDDLTLVVITNQNAITKDNLPSFDKEKWDEVTRRREEEIRAALYPESALKKDGEKKEYNKTDQKAADKNGGASVDERMVSTCPKCGEKIRSRDAKYCHMCGATLHSVHSRRVTTLDGAAKNGETGRKGDSEDIADRKNALVKSGKEGLRIEEMGPSNQYKEAGQPAARVRKKQVEEVSKAPEIPEDRGSGTGNIGEYITLGLCAVLIVAILVLIIKIMLM